MLNLAVLISGNGSNLQAIIDAIANQQLAATISVVISDQPQAYGLVRAQQAKIEAHCITATTYPKRADYDQALQQCISRYTPELIVLAGFMRILTPRFVQQYPQQIINLHPSLLPKHKGLHTHQRALDAGDSQHGCSVHYVTAELDGGPVIGQSALAILPGETAEQLQQRVHQLEHQLYPAIIQQLAQQHNT